MSKKAVLASERRHRAAISPEWKALIAYAEERLRSSQLKTLQLEALIASLWQQAEAGDPTPMAIAQQGAKP